MEEGSRGREFREVAMGMVLTGILTRGGILFKNGVGSWAGSGLGPCWFWIGFVNGLIIKMVPFGVV